MSRAFLLSSLMIFATSVSTPAQDRFIYEFAKVDQPNDVPKYGVAFFNTATEFEDESQLYVQIRVVNDALQFIKADKDRFRADFEVSVAILDTSGTEVQTRTWSKEIYADNFDDVNARNLFMLTQNSFFLNPGFYKFRIELKDQETRRVGRTEGTMTLRDFSSNDFMASDVVIMDSVNFASVAEPGLIGLERSQGSEASEVLAYLEVYNAQAGDSIEIQYEVSDGDGGSITSKQFWITSTGRITKTFFELSADLVFAGRNELTVEAYTVTDSIIVGPQRSDPYRQVSYPIYAQLAASIEMLKYIAKKDELKRLRELKGEAQLEEFKKFWQKRDPSPDSPENEYLEEFYRRVAVA
ncbi:GWxTD domain-containing protein, partial [bacterium]|nr:GWxTD domain-containing protein [bacterium]